MISVRKGGKPLADRSMLVQAAAEAAGGQQYPAPALYVVATPIGNLADMTLRALHVLALVDAIACEDTRHSATLLRHFDIAKPLLAVHEHNERAAAAGVVARLARGERVACISDAGTPAISDPGAALVAAVREPGSPWFRSPAPAAPWQRSRSPAMSSRGGFCFVGFLPSRGRERTARARGLRTSADGTDSVRGAASHRLAGRFAGSRLSAAHRDPLSRADEAVRNRRDPAGTGPARLARRRPEPGARRICPRPARRRRRRRPAPATARSMPCSRRCVAALPLKQAVALAAQIGGASRNVLYERALQMKGSAAPSDDAG